MKEDGSSSISLLVILVTFSLVVTGTVVFLQVLTRYVRQAQNLFESREQLTETANEIVNEILLANADKVDSPLDPIFPQIESFKERGYEVSLPDLSSRLGVNWIRKSVLEKSNLLNPRYSPDDFQQYREDAGIHLNLHEHFQSYFKQELDLDEYFTPYSFFNINITDEFVLQDLYEIRSGDAIGAEFFRNKVHDYRLETKEEEPLTSEELPDFLGPDYPLLFPLVNAEPVLNVNFVPEAVLRILFDVCGIQKPEEKLESLLASRKSRPLDLEALEFIFQEDYKKTSIHQYLGCQTWFWKLRVESATGEGLEWVLAKSPIQEEFAEVFSSGSGESSSVYRILEEGFTQ